MYRAFRCDKEMNNYLERLSDDTGISISELIRLAVDTTRNRKFRDKICNKRSKTYPIDISDSTIEEEIDMGDITIRIGNSHMMPS